jgi:hypothetical protein
MNDYELNLLFRGGDEEHTFEYAKTIVPEWKDKEEIEVLIERVKAQKKPIASIVLDNYEDRELVWSEILSESELCSVRTTNEWGMDMAHFTAMPNWTLGELATQRIRHHSFYENRAHQIAGFGMAPSRFELLSPPQWMSLNELVTDERPLISFLEGFDMSDEAKAQVTQMESALLLGYPL